MILLIVLLLLIAVYQFTMGCRSLMQSRRYRKLYLQEKELNDKADAEWQFLWNHITATK